MVAEMNLLLCDQLVTVRIFDLRDKYTKHLQVWLWNAMKVNPNLTTKRFCLFLPSGFDPSHEPSIRPPLTSGSPPTVTTHIRSYSVDAGISRPGATHTIFMSRGERSFVSGNFSNSMRENYQHGVAEVGGRATEGLV